MKRKIIIITLIFLLSTIIIVFYISNKNENYTCIDDFNEFAFVIPDSYDYQYEAQVPIIPWELYITFPDEFNGRSIEIKGFRKINGQIEIWFHVYTKRNIFLIYNLSEKSWKEIYDNIEGTNIVVDTLFIHDNKIYGKNYWSEPSYSYLKVKEAPILSIYNEESQRFEFIEEALNLPLNQRIDEDYSSPTALLDFIVMDKTGNFWIYNQKNTLYYFDPIERSLEKAYQFDENFKVRNIIVQDEKLIFQRHFKLTDVLKDDIFEYDIKDKSIRIIEYPKVLSGVSISATSNGNLWLRAYAWMSNDYEWHILYPYSDLEEFVKFQKSILYLNGKPPWLIFESSDGRLWFGSFTDDQFGGTAWFDPKTKEGCQISNYYGKFIEVNNYLWTVVENGLYRVKIK